MLRRDWRAGELNVLIIALMIAITGMTTVEFFIDRVKTALVRESNQLLGADLLIISSEPIADTFQKEAESLGLKTAEIVKFPSMISNGEHSLLIEIRAVTAGYPLRGSVQLHPDTPIGLSSIAARSMWQIASSIPQSGTIWVDEKVLHQLMLKKGDSVDVGTTQLRVSEFIAREPDHSVGFISMGSRILMNAADLEKTELIQLGSRVSYNLQVAGDEEMVQRFRHWAQMRLSKAQRIEGIRDARPEIKVALERSEKFLNLAALAVVVMAAAAIALAVRQFTQRHLDGCAIMRSLGASQNQLLALYVVYFLNLGLMTSGIGCLIGFATQEILSTWLTGLTETVLPLPSFWPVIHGFAIGLVLLLGFALPPILNLRSVSTMRVLRRDIGLSNKHGLIGYLLGLLVLATLFIWKAQNLSMGLYIVMGFILAILLFGGFGWLLIKMLASFRQHANNTWRYGLASIHRRSMSSILQIVALGLGLMALLVMTLIQDDLIEDWHTSLPPDAPNYFLVNIQADQLDSLKDFFQQQGAEYPEVFPMVRGRLIKINGKVIAPEDFADDLHAERHIRREFNLSWASQLNPDNQVTQGVWWGDVAQPKPELSIEQGIAKIIGIKLGDELTYDIAGSHFSAPVTSIRKVNWDSFRVNFFVVTPPGLLEQYPFSYITSFYVPTTESNRMHELVRAFPNILVVDMATVINQVQGMIEKVSQAVRFVFIFTVLAGFSVLYAAITATQDERIYEAAIFRTLGAHRQQLQRAWAVEFALLGGLAGLLAAAGASILGYVIAEHILHFEYRFNPWIGLIATPLGALIVLVAGLLGTRAALSTPPISTLRKLA